MSTLPQIIACSQCFALNRIPGDKPASKAKCGKCGNGVFQGKPVKISQGNFSAVVEKSSIPVLIDFWADWCGPCKMMAPVLDQAAAQIETKIRVGKIDTESERGLAAKYNIRSIPTMILFRQGVEVARTSGAMSLPQLLSWLNQYS